MGKGRLNIYLSKELEMWYREQAAKAGVSISNVVAMALHTYREQKDALKIINDLSDLVERFGQIEEAKA